MNNPRALGRKRADCALPEDPAQVPSRAPGTCRHAEPGGVLLPGVLTVSTPCRRPSPKMHVLRTCRASPIRSGSRIFPIPCCRPRKIKRQDPDCRTRLRGGLGPDWTSGSRRVRALPAPRSRLRRIVPPCRLFDGAAGPFGRCRAGRRRRSGYPGSRWMTFPGMNESLHFRGNRTASAALCASCGSRCTGAPAQLSR